jgi:uncharacterized DUF497 family protein
MHKNVYNHLMERLFEWDTHKAALNLKKHKISFEEAALVFDDPFVLTEQDRIDNGEYRWQSIGMINSCLFVLVAHTIQTEEDNEIIRIVSARRADKKERNRYEHR